MANAREIQSRMKSIKDTMKITNAMYMVSSSKLQKARRDLKNTEPYFYLIQDSLAKILDAAPEAGNRFFDKRTNKTGKSRTVGYLVITADKGLAGAYNHNVIKLAENIAENEESDMLFVVGQLGRHYFEKKDIPIDINFSYTAQNPTMNRARHIAGRVTDLFLEEKIDELYIIYTKMVNSMTVEAVSKKILPLKADDIEKQDTHLAERYENASFLPDAKTVFQKIVPDYITGFIYGALVESYCSEHNSRMMAMQTATDSATTMIRELSIQYNRARQAAITQEITEVVGGCRASKDN
ncbi:MAG: ATP synthase F1 subunit gamma [Eubacterium sp.]